MTKEKTFWQQIHSNDSYVRLRKILFDGHTGLLCLLILICGLNVIARTHLLPLEPNGDTQVYLETAAYFAGEDWGVAIGHRLLKPLAPLGVYLIRPYVSGDYFLALVLESVFFYFLLAIIMYFFAYHFLRNRMEAFVASLIYITSYPMLMYGLDVYTETGAWFFHLIGLYYAVRYYRTPAVRFVVVSAVATTIGLFWKEYAALSGVALVLLILLARTPWKAKFVHAFVAALIALPALVGWQVYVYQVYDYSYLDWFVRGHEAPEETFQYSPFYMAKSTFALLLLAWLLVLGGVLKWRTLPREDRIPILVAGVTSLGFLAWGYVSSRLYFVLMPVISTIAGRGLAWCKGSTLKVVLVVLVLCASYAWLIVSNIPEVRTWLSTL